MLASPCTYGLTHDSSWPKKKKPEIFSVHRKGLTLSSLCLETMQMCYFHCPQIRLVCDAWRNLSLHAWHKEDESWIVSVTDWRCVGAWIDHSTMQGRGEADVTMFKHKTIPEFFFLFFKQKYTNKRIYMSPTTFSPKGKLE